VYIVESLSSEGTATGAADEAGGVVQVVHCLAGLPCPLHLLSTGVAYS